MKTNKNVFLIYLLISINVGGCALFETSQNNTDCEFTVTAYLPPVAADLSFEKISGAKEQVIVPDEYQHALLVGKTKGIESQVTLATTSGLDSNTYGIETVYFAFNQSSLSDSETKKVKTLIDRIGPANLIHVDVEGHTDSLGSTKYNQRLSELRAKTVKNVLVSIGVNPDMISTRGLGKLSPVAPNDTEEHRKKNRRTEIVPFTKY